MDYIFWRKQNEYEKLYNCSFYDFNRIPKSDRAHPILGITFIILFIIFETFYIPSLIVLRQKQFSSQPCCKIMFYMGCVDVVCLWINGLATGIFAILGYVFCSQPILELYLGAIALGLWIAESDVGMILALNRCFEMYNTQVAASVFGGKMVYFWLMIPTVHGFYAWLFSKPVSFNSTLLSWFFNPHIGYYNDPEMIYADWLHTINNFTVLIVMSILYVIFLILFLKKSTGLENNVKQKQIFVQVFCICSVTLFASAIYIYENFFPVPNVFIIIGSYAWCCAHGFPSIIYVTMNATIRKEVFKLIGPKKYAVTGISSLQQPHST